MVQDVGDVTFEGVNTSIPSATYNSACPVDSLRPCSRLANYGSKMGIDATRKWSTEGFARPWPDEIVMDAKTRALVDSQMELLAKELGME